MVDKPQTAGEAKPVVAATPATPVPGAPVPPGTPGAPPPRRGPGHRSHDVRDTVAEMALKAQEISLEAGSKMAAAMKDVINAAAGITGFAVESARDLVQYMVRRGQMTQDEADKLIREAEEAQKGKKPVAKPVVAAAKPAAAAAAARPAEARAAEPPRRAPEPAKKAAAKPAAKVAVKSSKPAAKKPAGKSASRKSVKPAAKKKR